MLSLFINSIGFSDSEQAVEDLNLEQVEGFCARHGTQPPPISAHWAECLEAGYTHRPLSSSFLGLPYRILNIIPQKELLRGLWVKPFLI